jgi:hypothetical protein
LDKYVSGNIQKEINNKLIELLLSLRFNEEKNQIIKNNNDQFQGNNNEVNPI